MTPKKRSRPKTCPKTKKQEIVDLVILERAANDPDFDVMSWESDDGYLC